MFPKNNSMINLRKIAVIGLIFALVPLWLRQGLAEQDAISESIPSLPAVNLEELIQTALERNPDIIAAKAEWLAEKKRIWIDSSLPDPMGEFDLMGSMRETRVGPEQNRYMISQDIPFPLKLWEKGKMAGDEARAAFARYHAVERDIVNELKKLYYELYYVDASIDAIGEIKEILKKFEGVAQARYANMSGAQRDVAKAQAEVSMSLEKLFMLRQKRESVIAMLNAILDHDPMTSVGKAIIPEKPVLEKSLTELINLSVLNRQEIKEMEAMVSKGRREKTLAKLDFIPDLNVGFDYTFVGDGFTTEAPDMDGRDSWMFPLRINLPIWPSRNIPAIQEAQKKLEASKARLKKAENTAFYEVKDAYHRFDSARQIVDLYETAVIPQAKLALSADQAGYESGRVDFLTLLDSERVYLNAKLTHIEFFAESLKSYADLVRAAGLDLNKDVIARQNS